MRGQRYAVRPVPLDIVPPMLRTAAPTPFLDDQEGTLRMAGVPLAGLVARFGTPFFLIGEARLIANYRAIERGLGPSGVIRYCAKANHEAAVLEPLARCGSHLLASHGAEVELALRCGFPPERIAYARPVLTPEELGAVVAAGVSLIHVHRPADLDLLESAAARAGRRVRVSLRLRDESRFALSPLDRLNRRLGLGEAEVLDACRRFARSPWIEPAAIKVYLGTQQSSLDGFAKVFRGVLALLARAASQTGVFLREVNLGGGIPSPSLRRIGPRRLLARWRDRPVSGEGSQEDFANRLALRFREMVDRARLPERPTLAAEPGRSIVGDAVILVSRVRGLNGKWAFLDASRNALPESPLMFSRRILPLAQGRAGEGERFYHLSGSTLNTLDVLDLRRRLPRLEVGDTLAFCDAGAYSISRASSYAGVTPAVYVLQEDGGVRLARRAGGIDQLLDPMVLREEPVEVER
jgi:diaminopimelate decarboxylase